MPNVLTRITLTLYGELASLKNSREFVYVNGKPRLIPKQKARDWEQAALLQIPLDHRVKLTGPIRLTCDVYYRDRRSDLDVALLMDVLQHAEVYANDRQVCEIHATKKLDRESPRVELVLEELSTESSPEAQ